MRQLLCCLLIVLFDSQLGAAEPTTLTEADLDKLAAKAQQRWKAPGLAIAVLQLPQEPILKGFGVRQLGQPELVTPDTVFPMASCTKLITATIIAQLVDEGRLRWDDPITKHWPEFKWSDPNITALTTVRDLLSHRSGLAGHDLLWYRAPWTLDEVLRKASQLPIEGQFRHSYHYSSIPVLAAGRLAEKVTRKPWSELVKSYLASPLELEPLAFTTAEYQKFSNRAYGHKRNDSGEIESMPEYEIREPNPAGSLATSTKGLATWLTFQLRNGKTLNGRKLLSELNLQQSRTPHVHMPKDEIIGPLYPLSKQISYCLGWVQFDYRGELAYAHGGLIDGFRCQITMIPERGVGIALFNNLHESKLNIGLTYAVLDHWLGHRGTDWIEHFWQFEEAERKAKKDSLAKRDAARIPGTKPSFPLERYTAEYQHPAYGTTKVTLEKGELLWEWSSFRSELEHYQNDVFRIKSGYFANQLVEFGGQNGQVLAVQCVGQVFRRK
jgi:CubicO group peptidase (beta-lactamase class C family)